MNRSLTFQEFLKIRRTPVHPELCQKIFQPRSLCLWTVLEMSRQLSDYDWEILKKLAPELCGDGTCSSSGRQYRSILPPVSRHYTKSREDFLLRVEKLTDEELDYLICLAENGEESLTCIIPEHKDEFIGLVARRTTEERAKKLKKFVDFLASMEWLPALAWHCHRQFAAKNAL